MSKHLNHKSFTGWIIGLITICLIGILMVFMNVIKIPYNDTEIYTEKEPNTEEKCTTRDYQALLSPEKTGFSLYDSSNNPVTNQVQKYCVTNYEDKIGSFNFEVDYWDEDLNILYKTEPWYGWFDVGPKATYCFDVYYSQVWSKKPSNARAFSGKLDVQKLTECKTNTVYKDSSKTRTITKYESLWEALIGKNR